ncbi:MAG: DNA repair and recombination protein RadB [Candidatus Pacearchaeota archaeon]
MKAEKISSGNKDFDLWLNGGYEPEIITCLYGPFGSGKTNFCLMATASVLSTQKKVVYVDTESSFSLERLKQILLSKSQERDILKNLIIIKPTSFEEQIDALEKILTLIRNQEIKLVIVDSIGMLYRLELGLMREEVREEVKNGQNKNEKLREQEKIRRVNLALARQLRLLSEIARKNCIPVIVTNQIYQGLDGSLHMVGGDLLKYWSKCLIQLENLGEKKKAVLIKHRSLGIREFNFRITNNGIEKIKKFLF